jgi:hypothetical protein
MAGQALADRRARRREREARRETFQIQNFTAQREALMKIQEMVEEFGDRLNDELSERAGERFSAFAATPEGEEFLEKAYLARTGSSSDEQRYSEEAKRGAELFKRFKDEYNRNRRLSADAASKEAHFLREFRAFTTVLTMQANRTGSQFIVTEVRSYIGAALGYADERDNSEATEWAARNRLQAAITKALTEGPLAA